MSLGWVSSQINPLVRKAFGFGYRADWKLVYDDDGKLLLDNSPLPDIISHNTGRSTKKGRRPIIAAKISWDGRVICASRKFENQIKLYGDLYYKKFGKAPELKFLRDYEFQYLTLNGRLDYLQGLKSNLLEDL